LGSNRKIYEPNRYATALWGRNRLPDINGSKRPVTNEFFEVFGVAVCKPAAFLLGKLFADDD